jgi:hypothetical protein
MFSGLGHPHCPGQIVALSSSSANSLSLIIAGHTPHMFLRLTRRRRFGLARVLSMTKAPGGRWSWLALQGHRSSGSRASGRRRLVALGAWGRERELQIDDLRTLDLGDQDRPDRGSIGLGRGGRGKTRQSCGMLEGAQLLLASPTGGADLTSQIGEYLNSPFRSSYSAPASQPGLLFERSVTDSISGRLHQVSSHYRS